MFDIENINNSWNEFFNEEIKNELEKIYNNINPSFFPNEENVLRFAKTNFNNLKCVIVGMEPYPSSFIKDGKLIPEATGRSFEVNSLRDKTWSEHFKQSSLRNMLKTIYYNETNEVISLEKLRGKIEQNEFKILQPGQLFDNLENQGVLFLNASLSVIPGKVDTHTKIWENFMNELIPFIDKKNVKWLLWGQKAQDRVLPLIDENNAVISCHPRLAQFVNENPFQYVKEINWTGC